MKKIQPRRPSSEDEILTESIIKIFTQMPGENKKTLLDTLLKAGSHGELHLMHIRSIVRKIIRGLSDDERENFRKELQENKPGAGIPIAIEILDRINDTPNLTLLQGRQGPSL